MLFKKSVSMLLAFSVIISSAAFLSSAADSFDFTAAVASDLHYTMPAEALEGDIDDEIYWYANRRAAMENESSFIIDEFLRQCADNGSDCVLISGDLADNGRRVPQQHIDVAKKLADFEEATGKQVFVIDGNHDLGYDTETDVDDFKRIYSDFGYDEALEIDENSCSYTADLNEKYRLIALDSCDHSVSTADGLNASRVAWLSQQAQQAKKDGKAVILMMHHNLLDHMPLQSIFSKKFIVRNHLTYADLFANMGIKTVFTGHEHCSDVSSYTSSLGNKIYDFATTSLTMYPLQYRKVEFSDDKIKYSAETVDSIDTDALSRAVSGYSQAQLSAMNNGLNSYALGFLKAGVQYRLELSLSMEKIGISEGEAFYNLVSTAVGGLTGLLSMPLYGEQSVSSLAKEYNIDIPQSSYENGWDLATAIVAAHYAGGESCDMNSTEITILLRTAVLILRDTLSEVTDEVFLKAANSLLEGYGIDGAASSLTKLGTKVFGSVTAGEYFLLALASPIIYEFAYDSDGTDDNNGEITGYFYESSDSSVRNIFEKLSGIMQKILYYLSLFTKYAFAFIR